MGKYEDEWEEEERGSFAQGLIYATLAQIGVGIVIGLMAAYFFW